MHVLFPEADPCDCSVGIDGNACVLIASEIRWTSEGYGALVILQV